METLCECTAPVQFDPLFISEWFRCNAVSAHDLLQGLPFKPALAGGTGNISLVFTEQFRDIGFIKFHENVFFGFFVRQIGS